MGVECNFLSLYLTTWRRDNLLHYFCSNNFCDRKWGEKSAHRDFPSRLSLFFLFSFSHFPFMSFSLTVGLTLMTLELKTWLSSLDICSDCKDHQKKDSRVFNCDNTTVIVVKEVFLQQGDLNYRSKGIRTEKSLSLSLLWLDDWLEFRDKTFWGHIALCLKKSSSKLLDDSKTNDCRTFMLEMVNVWLRL